MSVGEYDFFKRVLGISFAMEYISVVSNDVSNHEFRFIVEFFNDIERCTFFRKGLEQQYEVVFGVKSRYDAHGTLIAWVISTRFPVWWQTR